MLPTSRPEVVLEEPRIPHYLHRTSVGAFRCGITATSARSRSAVRVPCRSTREHTRAIAPSYAPSAARHSRPRATWRCTWARTPGTNARLDAVDACPSSRCPITSPPPRRKTCPPFSIRSRIWHRSRSPFPCSDSRPVFCRKAWTINCR